MRAAGITSRWKSGSAHLATETWTLTIRAGPRVEHERFDALDPALDALNERVGRLAGDAASEPTKTQLKRYTPAEQVVGRVELAGPQKRLPSVHGGVDIRGDGSTEAYVGRVRRRALDPEPGEDGVSALRRALLNRGFQRSTGRC